MLLTSFADNDFVGATDVQTELFDFRSSEGWERAIAAIGPAALLVVIDARLGEALRRHCTPEDILQDALMHAWRDKERCNASDRRSFRAWLLTIIDNRIRDIADRESALKRGGGRAVASLNRTNSTGGPTGGSMAGGGYSPAAGSTTPSRVAVFREQAAAMREALSGLPEDCRDIVRMRLFEQTELEAIAQKTGLHISAVYRRFRKGLGLYHERLRAALATRSGAGVSGIAARTAKTAEADPASML